MESVRLPRFHRSPDVRAFTPTDRDHQIVRYIFEHRFLRSTHLFALVHGSRQQILRRLQLLFHHGYLDRPRAQLDYYRSGSRAMVYALGKKGTQLLECEDGVPQRKLDWTARNRSVTRYFMEHTLAVAEVMVALEISCRQQRLELIRHQEAHSDVFKWTVPVRHGGVTVSTAVVPDRVFGIKDPSGTRWFFLEADRATMPVERSSLKQTSFVRKLLAYHETWRQKTLRHSFPRFQVLTVTTTSERVKNLWQTAHRLTHGKGAGLFLFVDHAAFESAKDILAIPVLNGRGEQVLLQT